MKKILFLVLWVALSSTSKAEVVCSDGVNKVIISNDRKTATVSGKYLNRPQVFRNLSDQHGILNAPGFAFFAQNAYVRLLNATIITQFSHIEGDDPSDSGYVGVMEVAACSTGSQP